MSTFIVEAGLAAPDDSSLVSFQSLSYPSNYLHNHGGLIWLEPLPDKSSSDYSSFVQQATFKKAAGLEESLWQSFAGYLQADTNNYVRHQNFDVKIQVNTGDDLFKRDSTFYLIPPNWSHQEMLNCHNWWRQKVNYDLSLKGVDSSKWLPDLQWSDELASSAQIWANKQAVLLSGTDNAPSHSGPGENLYRGHHYSTGVMAVFSWVVEEKFRFDNKLAGTTGHYTQIVWRDTKSVGGGMATYVNKAGRTQTIWVCQYDPPGNVQGQQPY